jgi:hypothetical protein
MDWITWVLAAGFAAVVVALVVVIITFVNPVRNSPARHIVKAKREGKPVMWLDCGAFFSCVIGEDKNNKSVGEKADMIRTSNGGFVRKTPKALKYCEGVLMGFGEDFRSMVANVAIMELIEAITRKEWSDEEINKKLLAVIDKLKSDLNMGDARGELTKQYEKRIRDIDDDYNKKRAELIEVYEVEATEVKQEGVTHGND